MKQYENNHRLKSTFFVFVFSGILLSATILEAATAPADSHQKWFDALPPETKTLIAGVALVGIAVLVGFAATRKYRIPSSEEARFTLDKYEQELKRKINELKIELKNIADAESPEKRKVSAALREAEERLAFIESGYEKAVKGMAGLAGELEVLRGWISETEIESAETMLAAGSTQEARAIWDNIARESRVRKEAYARREADAWFHLGLLARADLDYKESMEAFINSIETGKAGIVHIAEAAHMAIKIGDYRNAEGLYREALSTAVGCDECTQDTIRNCQTGLADIYMHSGKPTEAQPLYKTALDTCLEIYGEQATPTADIYVKLARLHKSQGQEEESAEYCNKAMNIFSQLLPSGHPKVVEINKMCGS